MVVIRVDDIDAIARRWAAGELTEDEAATGITARSFEPDEHREPDRWVPGLMRPIRGASSDDVEDRAADLADRVTAAIAAGADADAIRRMMR